MRQQFSYTVRWGSISIIRFWSPSTERTINRRWRNSTPAPGTNWIRSSIEFGGPFKDLQSILALAWHPPRPSRLTQRLLKSIKSKLTSVRTMTSSNFSDQITWILLHPSATVTTQLIILRENPFSTSLRQLPLNKRFLTFCSCFSCRQCLLKAKQVFNRWISEWLSTYIDTPGHR